MQTVKKLIRLQVTPVVVTDWGNNQVVTPVGGAESAVTCINYSSPQSASIESTCQVSILEPPTILKHVYEEMIYRNAPPEEEEEQQ
jgi:hypothetical protein